MNKSPLALVTALLLSAFASQANAGPFRTLQFSGGHTAPTVTIPAHRMLTIVNFIQSNGPAQGTTLYITTEGATSPMVIYASTQSGTTAADNCHHAPEGIVVVGPATID